MTEITVSQAWLWFVGACAAVATIAKAWDIIKHWGKGDLQAEIRKHSQQLDNDNKRIKNLEESQIIMMQTLLALTRHAIDGNNIEGLKRCTDDLQNYLIHRQ